MKQSNHLTETLKFCVIFNVGLCLFLCSNCSSTNPEQSVSAQANQANTSSTTAQSQLEVLQGVPDLCLYQTKDYFLDQGNKDANHQLYQFINAGYPKEVSIDEAVLVFNKFAQCDDRGKIQPPLSVEEVKAAIHDWDCMKEKDAEDKKFCVDAWKIAETGKMPKGSFFDFDRGTGGTSRVRGYKGYYVNTWEIFLYLHLDKYRRDLKDVPEFTRSMRLKYISSEHIKDVQQ